MVCLHLLPCNFLRPMLIDIEREHLRAGQHQKIIAFQELTHGLRPVGAQDRCRRDIARGLPHPRFNFIYRFGLEQGAFGRIVVKSLDRSALLPTAKPYGRLPQCLKIKIRRGLLDDATEGFEGLCRLLTNLEYPRLAVSMPLEVRPPGNPPALERTLEPPLKPAAIAFH